MAVYLPTKNSAGLLAAFKKAIDERHIVTWSYNAKGDFFHTPAQWKDKAVMRPMPITGTLQFGIVGRPDVVTWPVYAVYHGRLIEDLISHFHARLGTATASIASRWGGIAETTVHRLAAENHFRKFEPGEGRNSTVLYLKEDVIRHEDGRTGPAS